MSVSDLRQSPSGAQVDVDGVYIYEINGRIYFDLGYVNVMQFGAVGDGSSGEEDTNAFEEAIATGKPVYIPQPPVSFDIIRTLRPKFGQTIRGAGKYARGVLASMPEPLFEIGNLNGTVRKVSIYDLNMQNTGVTGGLYGPCINLINAPNWSIENCLLVSKGLNVNTIQGVLSYRGLLLGCEIQKSGAGWCYQGLDNMNAVLIKGCVMSGGAGGGVANLGGSYNVAMEDVVCESTLLGIRVGTDPNGGASSAIALRGINFEQCSEPFRLGDYYGINGLTVQNCFISNASDSVIAPRTACMVLGRIIGGSITDCRFNPHATEDVFRLYGVSAQGYRPRLLNVNNIVIDGTPANYVALDANGSLPAYWANGTINEPNYIQATKEATDGIIIGEEFVYESPVITCNAAVANTLMVPNSPWGMIFQSVELFNVIGTLDGTLRFGTPGVDVDENLSLDMAGVAGFSYGYKDITSSLLTSFHRAGSPDGVPSNYPLIMSFVAGVQVGTFRVRVRVRSAREL